MSTTEGDKPRIPIHSRDSHRSHGTQRSTVHRSRRHRAMLLRSLPVPASAVDTNHDRRRCGLGMLQKVADGEESDQEVAEVADKQAA